MPYTITIVPAPSADRVPGTKATFIVTFAGFTAGEALEVAFIETTGTDEEGSRTDRTLGNATGVTQPMAGKGTPRFTFAPDAPPPAPPAGGPDKALVAFRFPVTAPLPNVSNTDSVYVFELNNAKLDVDEGEWWELKVQAPNQNVQSRTLPIARIRRAVGAKLATYDWHDGNTTQFFRDGAHDSAGATGAFHEVMLAIDQAQHFIFIADWSFHPMFRPVHGPALSDTIGQKLIAKAASIPVAIHTWDHTNIAAPDPQNDNGNTHLDNLAGPPKSPKRPANLLWRASSHNTTGMSHHQKYILLDAPAPGGGGKRILKAFFGGLDLTKGRYDWGDHPILPGDPLCAQFRSALKLTGTDYDDWYNAEFADARDLPRQPWHDIYGSISGPAAWDFVREFVGRWNVDPSSSDAMGDDSNDNIKTVSDLFVTLFDRAKFVQQWEPHNGPWGAQVYRSLIHPHWREKNELETPARTGKHREFQWTLANSGFEMSIQDAYRQAIDQAEKFIYIETQYLIGSGAQWGRASVANDLERRIVDRTLERMRAGLPFHTYVVMPMFPEGIPTSFGAVAQRQFEWNTMQYMARTLWTEATRLGKDWRDYISFCFLANWNTVGEKARVTAGDRAARVRGNQRYMIYVHSKLMIVDDRYIIFGSANLNERSLAGNRDLEICTGMWPRPGREKECINQLRTFRLDLWREHFGGAGLPTNAANPESAACVASVRSFGVANYKHFRELSRNPIDGHLCIWPFMVDATTFVVEAVSSAPEGDMFIPDGVFNEGSNGSRLEWRWDSPGTHYAGGLAE